MQGAIVDDEGLALLDRHEDGLDRTDALMLKLEGAQVAPNAVLAPLVPLRIVPALRRSLSNLSADIRESLL